jgi:CxxC motif-containing protein (DUF1111 family)
MRWLKRVYEREAVQKTWAMGKTDLAARYSLGDGRDRLMAQPILYHGEPNGASLTVLAALAETRA